MNNPVRKCRKNRKILKLDILYKVSILCTLLKPKGSMSSVDKTGFLYSNVMKFCSGLTAHQTVDEDIAATTHRCSCITQEQHTGHVCLLVTDRKTDPAPRFHPQSDIRVTLDDSFKFIIERVWLGLYCKFPSWKPKYANDFDTPFLRAWITKKSWFTGRPPIPGNDSLSLPK